MTELQSGAAETDVARNEYRDGQVLSAAALRRDTRYFLARERQHASLAHMPGVLVGLDLKVDKETGYTLVEKGAAIDGQGRLILVPARHQIDTSFVQPPDRPSGFMLVELHYRHSGPEDEPDDPCATTDVGVVRETFEIKLTEPPLNETAPAAYIVSEPPSDDPELRAPVPLGMVEWNTDEQMFLGVSEKWRLRAGVKANTMLDPDDKARFTLATPDNRAKLEARAADGTYHDQLSVAQYDGTVWMRRASLGPGGAELRRSESAQEASDPTFAIFLDESVTGAEFGRQPPDEDTGESELAGNEYFSGDLEMRVSFERDGTGKGRRRLVIGHVGTATDPQGDTFRPSLVVYDRPSEGVVHESFASTVEVWGDLVVHGTTWLKNASKLTEGLAEEKDQLDLILRQIAGPLGELLRAWLESDPDWLKSIAGKVADELSPADYQNIASNVITNPTFVGAVNNEIDSRAASGTWLRTLASNLASDPTAMGAIVGGLLTAPNLDQVGPTLAAIIGANPAVGRGLCGAIAEAFAAGDPADIAQIKAVLGV